MNPSRPENRTNVYKEGFSPALFLVGFMGAGKTSVGRELASRLGWSFVDLDDRITARDGRSIADIFREDGESVFRSLECQELGRVISEARNGINTVIALGGGAFAQADNFQAICETKLPVIFLDATVEELRRRCTPNGSSRPLFQDEARFRELYHSRRSHYLQAQVVVDTTLKCVDEVVSEIMQLLATAQ